MTDDLITRMAEAAYKRRMERWRVFLADPDDPAHAWDNQSPEFRAEIRAEMEMLRDMVLAELREPGPQGDYRGWRWWTGSGGRSLF